MNAIEMPNKTDYGTKSRMQCLACIIQGERCENTP